MRIWGGIKGEIALTRRFVSFDAASFMVDIDTLTQSAVTEPGDRSDQIVHITCNRANLKYQSNLTGHEMVPMKVGLSERRAQLLLLTACKISITVTGLECPTQYNRGSVSKSLQ